MTSEAKQRKLGAVLSYVHIIAASLIQIVYTPFLVKTLGQSEYGLYSLAASIIGYLTVLDLGFNNALVVYTSKYHAKGEHKKAEKMHGMFLLVYSIIGVIAFLATVIISLNANNIFGATMNPDETGIISKMLIILGINLFITFLFSVHNAIIISHEKFIFQKSIAVANAILQPIVMIPLLLMGYKSVALCVAITILNLIVQLLNYYYCRNKINVKVKYQGFDKTIFKIIIGYSFWIFLASIVDRVNWTVDQTILGITSGAIAISVYSIASHFNTMIVNLSTAISGVMLPKITKMVANDTKMNEINKEFIRIGRIQLLIVALGVTGFFIFGKQFIKLWVGDGFDDSYYVALLLIVPALASLIQNTGLSIMQAMNKFKFKAIITSIMSILNVIISVILSYKYGAIGAAIGTTLTIVLCNIFMMNIYYKKVIKLDIWWFWKEIGLMSVKLAIPVLFFYISTHFININSWPTLLLGASFYVIIYVLYSYLFVINTEEKNQVSSILKKIGRKHA